jgi:DNA-binding NarL/FixJ family response regulator
LVVLAQAKTNTLKSDPLAPKPQLIRDTTRQRISSHTSARIVELYASGLSTRTVAQQLGVAKTTVLSSLHAAGVDLRPRGGRH